MDVQPVETTLYSLSELPPEAPRERREGDRLMTLYRVGSLLIAGHRELCLIKNISAGGMMVRPYCTIPEGTRLSVELKCGQPISGVVTWARELHAGIAFDDPIDVIGILSVSVDKPRPRLPRVAVDTIITLREGGSTYRVRVCDISQGGMKVECGAQLAPDSDVVITLPGIEPQQGAVRWIQDDQVGIVFNRLIALPTLVEWLRQQRDSVNDAN